MEKEKMLPAIFFLFSRKRCDEAVQFSDKAVTLTLEEKERLNRAIDEALDEHPSLQDNPHLKYLRQGVAAHHAGLLPMWKMLVENLFQQGLSLPIGIGAMPFGTRLCYWNLSRIAVHRSRRTEDNIFTVILAHHIQQYQCAINIILIILPRFHYRFPHRLQTCEMDATVKIMQSKHP